MPTPTNDLTDYQVVDMLEQFAKTSASKTAEYMARHHGAVVTRSAVLAQAKRCRDASAKFDIPERHADKDLTDTNLPEGWPLTAKQQENHNAKR